MSRNRNAQREADGRCSPTCPAVDRAFDSLKATLEKIAPEDSRYMDAEIDRACEIVKDKGTLLLRSALVEACEEIQSLESERDDLLKQVEQMEREVASLNDEIANMAKEPA